MTELHKITTHDGEEYIVSNGKSRFLLVPTPGQWGLPPIEFVTERAYRQDRLTEFSWNLSPRSFALRQTVEGCSRADLFAERGAVLNATKPNRHVGYTRTATPVTYTFVREDGTKRAIKGRPISPAFGPTSEDEWTEWEYTDDIQIECFDPLWFNPTQQSCVGVGESEDALVFSAYFGAASTWYFASASALIFDCAISYVNSESALFETMPKFLITGAASSFAIQHVELGLSLNYRAAVASSEVLTLDLDARTLISSVDGLDYWGYLTEDDDIEPFKIYPAPQVTSGLNTIRGSIDGSDGNTAFTVQYYERFIGI